MDEILAELKAFRAEQDCFNSALIGLVMAGLGLPSEDIPDAVAEAMSTVKAAAERVK